MKHFDVLVLGAGSAGELIATTLAKAGRSVALVESLRVGGECAYVSCMPSKAMLRSAQVRKMAGDIVPLGAARHSVDLGEDFDAFRWAAIRRDGIAEYRIDEEAADRARKLGVELFRGKGKFTGVDQLLVNSDELTWTDLVISTGSTSTIPDIDGLSEIDFWTSDEALSAPESPASVLIVGGGPVGCELAQIFSRFGTKTTIVQFSEQLADKEHPDIASRLTENLRSEGVDILLNTNVLKVQTSAEKMTLVQLSNGSAVLVERVIIAAGRHPSTSELNLGALGIQVNERGALEIDATCRVAGQEHVWAAGDVTGIAPFTHTANYQGRLVVDNLLGGQNVANYDAIPRAIYTDPPVASVGIMHDENKEDGLISARVELSQLSRNSTDGGSGGLLILSADRVKGVLVGAAAIGPHADEWLAQATIAIRAQVPLSVLCDVVHAFPTYGEAFGQPLRELLTQLSRGMVASSNLTP
ncbi:MAG: NAD(P)/FAD-dependent oxidoreductase [Actinobacteria bacterium]|nr:NAD(P)/FAD-dependent oxidoreductase [Actinomycetota bacterium]